MVVISESGADQVFSQILGQGYFATGDGKIRDDSSENDPDDSFDAFKKWTQHRQRQNDSTTAPYKGLIPTIESDDHAKCYYSPKGLARQLICRLQREQENSGRASLEDLCAAIGVDCTIFISTSAQTETPCSVLWKELEEESESSSVTILDDNVRSASTLHGVELVSRRYWERILKEVTEMVKKEGSLLVSDLSSHYALPRDAILNQLVFLDGDNGEIRLMDDSKCLVSDSYCRALKQKILEYFSCLEEPMQIDAVCQEQGWDLHEVLDWLTNHLEKNPASDDDDDRIQIDLKGEIHMDAATSGQMAMYLPTSYRKRQQQEILDFVSANGYITIERAVRNYPQGMLVGQVTTLVRDSFPDTIVLDDESVLLTESTLLQAQIGIQDYLSSASLSESEFLDLQEYLPAELIQSPVLLSMILENIGFNPPSDGVALVGSGRTIIVGKSLVQRIKDNQLSQIVQEYSKGRADQIFKSEYDGGDGDEVENMDDAPTSKKGGKSSKSKRKGKSSKQNSKNNKSYKGGVSTGVVPLSEVAKAVIIAYPSFLNDGVSYEDITADLDVDWEGEEEEVSEISLVVGFCRKGLYSKSFVSQCDRAVNAELQRLRSEKSSKAKMSRKDAAAKIRSVDAAFQDAFVTLCYLIQAQAKLVSFVASNLEDIFDETSIQQLKDEFLQGPCVDLISRITQHCLFQEEMMDDGVFTFTHPEDNDKSGSDDAEKAGEIEPHSSTLPPYCSDVNITARNYPKSYLSSPPPREPLPVLRESFSANTGVMLSKIWVLCGGECYRGGVRVIDDNEEGSSQSVHIRPGNMDAFLSYAEENCLTLCGLPFKKLDKKAEKNLLFSRKQQLISLLTSTDVATDPIGVLDYTIMILFQQVRSLVVSGSTLRGSILEALTRERKIPSSVGTAMKLLNETINGADTTEDEELVSLIKECGLARDINKHDTSTLEAYLSKEE